MLFIVLLQHIVLKMGNKQSDNMSEDVLADRIDNIAGGAEQTKETIIKQEITKYKLMTCLNLIKELMMLKSHSPAPFQLLLYLI
jgi:hypothetical protein